jgi:drug/metabolite transporter (DMT)-like permease
MRSRPDSRLLLQGPSLAFETNDQSRGDAMSIWKHLLVYSQLFFGMAFFGSGTPAAKIVTDTFPLFTAPFLRLLAAAILLTPFLIYHRHRLREISRRDWLIVAGIGGIGLFAFSIFLLTGMKKVNGVVGAVVMSLSPAALALGSVWFMNNRMGWRKATAVALAVAGVLIINVSGKSIQAGGWSLLIGSLLVFGAVCSQTAYSLFGKRVLKDLRPVVVLPLAAWVAVICFAIPGTVQALDFEFSKPNLNEWFALFWWGVGPFAIGTLIWFYGLEQVRSSIASGFMGAMPASALVLSYVWLGDKFHWIHLIGFALVFTSIGLISWAHRLQEKREAGNK